MNKYLYKKTFLSLITILFICLLLVSCGATGTKQKGNLCFAVSFSDGDPLQYDLDPGETHVECRFEARKTSLVRLTVLATHETRHYVGIEDILLASDRERALVMNRPKERALPRSKLVIRGRAEHPCVNVTRDDIRRAIKRIEKSSWAREERDLILIA